MRYAPRFEPAEGDSEEEALAMAKDALAVAMDFYFEERRTVPNPSSLIPGEQYVELPAPVARQVHLLNVAIRLKQV